MRSCAAETIDCATSGVDKNPEWGVSTLARHISDIPDAHRLADFLFTDPIQSK